MLRVNEYFDGNVKSIGFQGSPLAASVGVMAPGEYEFGTSQKETMTVVSGRLVVRLPDSTSGRPSTPVNRSWWRRTRSSGYQVAADTAYL